MLRLFEAVARAGSFTFGLARTADEDMRAFRELGRGTLRLGASTTIATYLLPPLLGRFVAEHPSVDVRLTSANTQEIVQRLLAYELDVALVEGPVAERRIAVTPWREDELVLIAASGHRPRPRFRIPLGCGGSARAGQGSCGGRSLAPGPAHADSGRATGPATKSRGAGLRDAAGYYEDHGRPTLKNR